MKTKLRWRESRDVRTAFTWRKVRHVRWSGGDWFGVGRCRSVHRWPTTKNCVSGSGREREAPDEKKDQRGRRKLVRLRTLGRTFDFYFSASCWLPMINDRHLSEAVYTPECSTAGNLLNDLSRSDAKWSVFHDPHAVNHHIRLWSGAASKTWRKFNWISWGSFTLS